MERKSAKGEGVGPILILGGTGMLGHVLFIRLSLEYYYNVYATVRFEHNLHKWFPRELLGRMISGVDADYYDSVIRAVADTRPVVVINCIGIIKQVPAAKDPIVSIAINSLFPHRLAQLCKGVGSRLIHISTDCVFDGTKGNYGEDDPPDAEDLYGRTKFLGEVKYAHCVTLRTSLIGHELKGGHGLIEWFLTQKDSIRGFTHAIFSGFPTVEMARIIGEYVIPNENLKGLYQVSSEPISKYELLQLVAAQYGKKINIEPYPEFRSDRSLDSNRFRRETGYQPPPWTELVEHMYHNFIASQCYQSDYLQEAT